VPYLADYETRDGFAIDASANERLTFIRQVYAHLLGATVLFIGCCAFFLSTPAILAPVFQLVARGQWWLLMIGFMGISWVAQKMAYTGTSRGVQYAGLGLYAVAEAVIFAPLMYFVTRGQPNGSEILFQAGSVTLLIFGGLTVIVMLSKADFSFMRNFLWLATLAATVVCLVSAFTHFSLGLIFVSAMVLLFSAWILYDTSNILHHYPTNQPVAAALKLFSSLATLFWYVIQLVQAVNRR
jgi:FtsH-binding integral membrane protein